MERTFIQSREFSKQWDALGFNDDDLRLLELDILQNPSKYPVVKGTGGMRKGRFALENTGKSGGVRVCYVDFVFAETIYLITVYAKADKDNLTKAERNSIKTALETIRRNLKGKKK